MSNKKPTVEEILQGFDDLIRMGLLVWNGKFRNGPHGMEPVYVAACFAPGLSREEALRRAKAMGKTEAEFDAAISKTEKAP